MTQTTEEILKELKTTVQNLEPSAIVELFQLDLDPNKKLVLPNILYFHAGTNELIEKVVWAGKEYLAVPIKAEGFGVNTSGSLARPKLTLANGDGLFSAYVIEANDLIGCKLTRIRTFVKYLDGVNFSNGNSLANSNIKFQDEVWYVDQKVSENRYAIEWDLASVFDLNGVLLPSRVMLQNNCPYQYKGIDCGYTGVNMFESNDAPTSNLGKDVCGKRLNSCEVRFGAKFDGLPFGGFPGIVKYEG
jgi:lambda family phage minor tail protein L